MSKEQKQNVEVECDYELSEYQKRGMMPCDYSGYCCGVSCENYLKCKE